jgi:3-oxoacyl-[acyl-carrier-protein] synthase-1
VHGDALLAVRELGLVRTPNSPIGFLPGEAAGFVLLETVRTARARGARIEAHLGAVALAEEDFDRFSRVAPSGKALQSATASCFQQWGAQDAEVGVAVVNLNGDTFRSRDFGGALVRMAAAGLPTGFRTVLPVDNFGELGAATGPVSLCLAVRSLVRRYARTQNLLVLLLDERRLRSALMVHAPQPQRSRHE